MQPMQFSSSGRLRIAGFILAILAFATAAPTLQNVTVLLPAGTTNHGNEKLICTPTGPTDILSFYFGNYVTHALTVVSMPGEESYSYLVSALQSLFFPAFGAYRGLRAIWVGLVRIRNTLDQIRKTGGFGTLFKTKFRSKPWEESELRKARIAGALCMMVRSESWKPKEGDEVSDVLLVEADKMQTKSKASPEKEMSVREKPTAPATQPDEEGLLVGSEIELGSFAPSKDDVDKDLASVEVRTYPAPWTYCREEGPDDIGSRAIRCGIEGFSEVYEPEYKLVMVPLDTPVQEIAGDKISDRISSSYSFIKGTVALVQTIFAVSTLYETRGDQVTEYGYASFGLTVAPYAIMSLINLLGSIARPEYDAIYLVGSPAMVEARRRKGLDGYHEGVVGEVIPDPDSKFSANQTSEGMSFIPGTVKFVSVNNRLHAKYASKSNCGSEEVSCETLQPKDYLVQSHPVDDLSIKGQTLFILSSPAFRYYPDNQGKPVLLPLPTFSDFPLKWKLPLLEKQVSIDPRSAHRLERAKYLSFIVSLTPLIPIGVISHFKAARSTVAQRVVTMLWFAWGSAIGFIIAWSGTKDVFGKKVKGKFKMSSLGWRIGLASVVGAPAIAGWVIVGSMLKDYGTCTQLPGS